MSETPVATQPERTETGTLVDQRTKQVQETEPSKETPKTDTTTETKSTSGLETKPSLLNDKEGEKPTESKGAPEKYEFKLPDGYELNEDVNKEASEIFKGLNLDNAGAQKLVDFYIAKTQEAADAPYKMYSEYREQQQALVKADPEIGPHLAKVKETVSKAIDSLGDPKLATEFRAAMDLTGAGDNLAFVKAFYKLAQRLTEGTHVTGGGPSKFGQTAPGKVPQSAASAIYPHLPQ